MCFTAPKERGINRLLYVIDPSSRVFQLLNGGNLAIVLVTSILQADLRNSHLVISTWTAIGVE